MTESFTVSELAARIEAVLADGFPDDVWVSGEIRDLQRSANGHVYFRLADAEQPDQPNSLEVVLWDRNRRAVNAMLRRTGSIRMDDGVRVRIRAQVSWYGVRGRLQLRMVGIDPLHTLGALEAERERVLRALGAEGLLERNASRPLPRVPHAVGLVTSLESAAYADFLHELEASGLSWRVVAADARVQGEAAERSLVAALAAVARRDVEVIALVRGGGARTDLAVFDRELLARAIATCPLPVLTGIGHEIDRSAADEIAAAAHKTPTACAAALVERARAHLRHADELWGAVRERALVRLDAERTALARSATRLDTSTRRELESEQRRVAVMAAGIRSGATANLRGARARLEVCEASLRALEPGRLLARGWSLTHLADGRLVRAAGDLTEGDELVTTFHDGSVHSRVLGVNAPPETGSAST